MSWYITKENASQLKSNVNNRSIDFLNKPIIIYNFVDLTCSNCWSLEPYLKKLLLEYGMFFTVRPILCHDTLHLTKKDSITTSHLKHSNRSSEPNPLLGVKAAGLQGNKAGRKFLKKVQEAFFLGQKDIYAEKALIECAEKAGLDIDEFKRDLYSLPARKAFICDMKIADEMDVNQLPTLVFFSQIVEDHTVKISGIQTYDTYVYILKKMLKKDPLPTKKPPLEDFLRHYRMVSLTEVAIVYDWSLEEASLKLKQLQLMQMARKVKVSRNNELWGYIQP